MSDVTISTCDGCGSQLGGDGPSGTYFSILPSSGCASIKLGHGWGEHKAYRNLDVCGPLCLLKVARRLNGLPEADELETAFLAPVAVLRSVPRSAPRKRAARP